MNLVVIATLVAACAAAKLDRTYLPPSSANTAGGSPGSLQTPLTRSSEQERDTLRLPTGSYTNDFGDVVVDAASPGTRASADADQSGLGNPRPLYGSSHSKVGDAAFRGSVGGFRDLPSFGAAPGQTATHGHANHGHFHNKAGDFTPNGDIDTHTVSFSPNTHEVNGQIGSQAGEFSSNGQSFESLTDNKSERPQAAKDRNSNILALSNDVNPDSYSYGFETDNGITVGENGVAVNGIQAEGGYSYQGDDGMVYRVTYTADEGGYRPQGAHLPTPPPIPEDILKSLEQNAKEAAAGIIDDGSYDAQKYNADGDYTHDNGGDIQYNGAQLSQFGSRPESDATVGSFNQNSQAFGTASAAVDSNSQNAHLASNGPSNQINRNTGVGQFGVATNAQHSLNAQSGQLNRNPGSTQLGGTGSQFNSLAASVNNQPASAQTETGHQSSHSSFEQSSFVNGNQFESSSATTGDTRSQSGHSSQPLSEHYDSSVQIGSQFGQQALASTPQGSNAHFGSKPVFDQGAASSSPSRPQFESSFNPQESEAFSNAFLNQNQDTQDYSKPSPQTFSGPNFNRPSAGSLTFNKLTSGQMQNKFGSATATRFNQVPQIASQFEANNEYLPPFSSNDQSSPKKPELSSSGFTSTPNFSGPNSNNQEPKPKDPTPNFVALNRPSFASAAASTSSFDQSVGNYQLQPAKPLNAINGQSQPNQFTQQASGPSSQSSSQFNKDSQQSGTLTAQSVSDFGSKPTTVPDTELTTPLEPNEAPNSQSSQLPNQMNFGFLGSKPVNNPAQAQFGFQENSAFGVQSNSQNLSPSFPTSSSDAISQFETVTAQSLGQRPKNPNEKPVYSQNTFGQKQPSLNQGFDNSYYYNQPSKTFKTPAMSQESRFPSSPAYQSNGVASQNQFFNQQSYQSSTKFPVAPSLAPVGPTSTTQFAQTQSYNGITQAAISPFPSVSPTPTSQFGTTHNDRFNQKSTFGSQNSYHQQPTGGRLPVIAQVNKKQFGSQTQTQIAQSLSGSSDSSPQQRPTQTQQYQGTIYEYNKPTEVLPAPTQTDSTSSQTIPAVSASESQPNFGQSQTNQLTTQQNSNPSVGLNAQGDYSNQNQQNGIQFNSQPSNPMTPSSSFNSQFKHQPAQPEAQPGHPFGASPNSSNSNHLSAGSSSSEQDAQELQTSQSIKPYGSASQGSQSSFETIQFGSRIPQLSQTTQRFGNLQPSKPESGSGPQFQFSSQTFQNTASSQDNGHLYPGFAERQNQFSKNTQSGSNKFIQNSSGSPQTTGLFNPQFGAETQDDRKVQAAFSQTDDSKLFNQPAFGQIIASGQAKAPASNSPQQYSPFASRNQNQYSQTRNMNGQYKGGQSSQQLGVQDSKPFGSNTQGLGEGSKPLFKSACCQNSKDSASVQTSASFQGTHSLNAQGVAGRGETFGGPRQPPRFDDQTGYHY